MWRGVLATMGCVVLAAVAAAATHPFSVHDMLAMDRISDPVVSPDGTRVAFTVRETDLEGNRGRADIFLAAVDGSWTRRLTNHPAGDSQCRWSPDGRNLFFLSARAGTRQVWRIPVDGGEAVQVTRLPLPVSAMEVSPTGDFLVLAMAVFPGAKPEETNARHGERSARQASGMVFDRLMVRHWDSWVDGTRNHLFRYGLATGDATDLMPDMDADCPTRPFGGSDDFTISRDGRWVVFSAKDVGRKEAWSTRYDLFRVPSDGSAAPEAITTNPAWDSHPVFSPDGRTLAYLAMTRPGYESDRNRIVLRDWNSGKERVLDLMADDSPRGDRSPRNLVWSADGKELYCTADHLGQRAVFAIDAASGSARILVGDGSAVSPAVAGVGRILFGRHSLMGPTELYTVRRDGTDLRRVTRLNDEKVARSRRGEAEQFTFTGAHGNEVYGYLVRPADFDPQATYPVAFLVHGGPQGSFGNQFHYRWNPQAYAGAGYAAVMIDFHGSTGYGQDFTDAINDDWGGAPFVDLMKGLDVALEKYPFLDGDRVGALGASYGGYMINWINGQTDRFRALVSHCGNIDERMAYFETEELWFPEWERGGTPWEVPESYSRHNPVDHVHKWSTPTLVIHGALDFRVVETQGIATFNALQRRGIPSRFLYFPDENHWVLTPHNSILWHETVIGWLDTWVKPESPPKC